MLSRKAWVQRVPRYFRSTIFQFIIASTSERASVQQATADVRVSGTEGEYIALICRSLADSKGTAKTVTPWQAQPDLISLRA